MLLAIDCGNTNVVFSVFDSDTLIVKWRSSTNADKTSDDYSIWLEQLLQREKIQFERWAGEVKYLHAQNGVIETKFNNGDVRCETRQKDGSYKTKWLRANADRETLMQKFGKALVDMRVY